MSLKRIFFKDSLLYGATSYLSVLAGIILTPIYTRFFSKEEYGIMDLVNTWNTFMLLLIPLGLTTAMVRLYYDYSENTQLKRTNLGTLLFALMVSSLLFVLVSWLLNDFLRSSYYSEETSQLLINLSYGIVVFNVITGYFQSLNRVEFNLKHYLTIQVIPFFILVILGYYLSISLNYRISGFFYAGFASSLTGLILALILGHRQIYFSFDFKALRGALKYSVPLLIVLVFLKFTSIVDRIIITHLMDLQSVGEFSIVTRISSLFQLAISSFAVAWIPYAMSVIHHGKRNSIYADAFRYYLTGFSLVALLITLFSKEIIIFFAPDYLNVEALVYFMLPTTLIGGLAHFMGLGIIVSKKSSYFIISALISFVINVSVSYILALYLGLYGIVIGSFVAILSWVLIEYRISHHLAGIVYQVRYILFSLLGLGFLSVLTFLFNQLEISWMTSIPIKFLFLLLTALFAWRSRMVRRAVAQLLRRKP